MFLFLNCAGTQRQEIRLSLILSDSEETINKALSALENGIGFAEVVRKYSSGPNIRGGGDFGYININDIQPFLREEALRLKIGNYSGIIIRGNEYYILLKTDERMMKVPINWQKIFLTSVLAVISTANITSLIAFL